MGESEPLPWADPMMRDIDSVLAWLIWTAEADLEAGGLVDPTERRIEANRLSVLRAHRATLDAARSETVGPKGCICGRREPMAGMCFDIDGNWWNGHGPDPLTQSEPLTELANWAKRLRSAEGQAQFDHTPIVTARYAPDLYRAIEAVVAACGEPLTAQEVTITS